MPRGDRTGPQGMGPRTGRAAGYCAGYDVPGYANPVPGRGYGMGYGGGRHGWRHQFYATGLPRWARGSGVPQELEVPAENEAQALRAQAEWLGEQLKAVQQRLDELDR
jgi:hypothetical protein